MPFTKQEAPDRVMSQAKALRKTIEERRIFEALQKHIAKQEQEAKRLRRTYRG